MFKKSPKNCFKPVLQSSTQVSGNGSGSGSGSGVGVNNNSDYENHNKASLNNGPILSYFNHFFLPQVDIHIGHNSEYIPLEVKVTHHREKRVYISSSIYAHLCDIKHQIEKYQDTWDNIKKFTNPYEYIHSNITGNKTNISKLRPLSRSFYKMIEIMKNNNLLSQYDNTFVAKPHTKMGIKTFHLAEGPGGFIEAIAYLRGCEYQHRMHQEPESSCSSIDLHDGNISSPIQILKRNTDFHEEFMKEQEYLKISRRIFDNQREVASGVSTMELHPNTYGNDRYYGMTLVNDDPICPGWKKTRAFLESHPNVIIETGSDKTGNLISLENFLYCAEKYKNKMDIVTADGGFDFSVDFNQQECMATQLILCEVYYALAMQKPGGSFILKIFDVFHKTTVDILYILSYYYKDVSIMKPYTSRVANSEKYVICQGFKIHDSTAIIEQFSQIFPSLNRGNDVRQHDETNDCNCGNGEHGEHAGNGHIEDHGILSSFLPFEHDLYFLNRIEEMNAMVSFQQIENITSTLSIITNHRNAEKLEQYKRTNVNKCIAWCEKYDIPYNAHHACFQSTNIFLHKSIHMGVSGGVASGSNIVRNVLAPTTAS
jgi:23S rRNA U2552 (ribose-2'-O)-methylase RlmE/FtsJ